MGCVNLTILQLDFNSIFVFNSISFHLQTVTIGIASETLNDWADEEAGLEAVQRVLDSLDDIHALQDEYVDEHILRDMLSDNRLCALLQVSPSSNFAFKLK